MIHTCSRFLQKCFGKGSLLFKQASFLFLITSVFGLNAESPKPSEVADKIEAFYHDKLVELQMEIKIAELNADGSWRSIYADSLMKPGVLNVSIRSGTDLRFKLVFENKDVTETSYLDLSPEELTSLQTQIEGLEVQADSISIRYKTNEWNGIDRFVLPANLDGCRISSLTWSLIGSPVTEFPKYKAESFFSDPNAPEPYSKVSKWAEKLRGPDSEYVGLGTLFDEDHHIFRVIHRKSDPNDPESVQIQEEIWVDAAEFAAGRPFVTRVLTEFLSYTGKRLDQSRDRQFKVEAYKLVSQ